MKPATGTASRYLLIWLGVVVALVLGASAIFGIPYIYSILGIAALVFVGHFVTPAGTAAERRSKPDESKRVWSGSWLQLLVKLAAVTILLGLLLAYPDITGFGA
jgi:hypothetical protein